MAQASPTPSAAPVRKVAAGGLAGAIVAVLMVVLGQLHPEMKWPDGFEAALTTIVTFIVSYLTPPAASEEVIVAPSGRAVSATTG